MTTEATVGAEPPRPRRDSRQVPLRRRRRRRGGRDVPAARPCCRSSPCCKGDGTACEPGDDHCRGARVGRLDADRGADRAQSDAAHDRHRDHDPPVRRGRGRTDHDPRHAEDHADAAGAREIRGPRRRGHQPSRRSGRRDADQGQPHPAGRGPRGSGAADEGRGPADADRGRGPEPRTGGPGHPVRRGHHPARQSLHQSDEGRAGPDRRAAPRWRSPVA